MDKGLIILAMAIPVYVQCLLWGLFALHHPSSDEFVNADILKISIFAQAILIGLGSLLAIAGLVIRKRKVQAIWFQHATLQFYCLSLVLLSYGIGTVSFAVGVVLLGATIFGLILLDRFAVWMAVATASALLLVLTVAAMLGHVPYAPIKPTALSDQALIFWLLSDIYFASPFLLLISLLGDQTLLWWRDREQRIRQLSEMDALTGLANRRSVFTSADAMMSTAGGELSIILIDLDHFKRINDDFGHATGDQALVAAAHALKSSVRSHDALGRYGGEEFIIFLPTAEMDEVLDIAERCRQAIAAISLHAAGQVIPLTASFGVTTLCQAHELIDHAIQRADEALYQAKHLGRNRVECLQLESGILSQHTLKPH